MTAPIVFAEVHGRDGEALRRFCAELFGAVGMPATEMPDGTVIGLLADPEGHTIGLVTPPGG